MKTNFPVDHFQQEVEQFYFNFKQLYALDVKWTQEE